MPVHMKRKGTTEWLRRLVAFHSKYTQYCSLTALVKH